jgi:methyltransferase (TIGR00027 family)
MARAAARTAASPTAIVAIEQHFPGGQRIIADDLASRILPFGGRAFVWLTRNAFVRDRIVRAIEKTAPGIWALMVCRKRYIDEKLLDSVPEIDAVVNLGAGYDTRVYRLQALTRVRTWEIDQPQNIERKRRRLRELFGDVPAHVTLVPIDFDREDLNAALTSHGYSSAMRTFFIWEGVTQYVGEAGIVATFEFLARAARGSHLAFTYVRRDFLDEKTTYGQEAAVRRFVVRQIWRFGMEPDAVDSFLRRYGWQMIEHLGYDELAERYVAPTGRGLAITPIERIVYAEKV